MKNLFDGRRPSHYHMNFFVKAFIFSESFFWAGYNFVYPLFSIFVVQDLTGGSIEKAAGAISVYMISRVISELIVGRLLEESTDKKKLVFSILGIVIVSLSYFSFTFVHSYEMIFVLQSLVGVGLGIISPAKYSLFSQHLNKKHATNEWSFYDAANFICMALAGLVGGFIAQEYGFQLLFKIAGMVIFLGVIPYLLILLPSKKN